MKALFKALRDTMAAVPGIRWVDYDMGQLDEEQPPVSWPCALFSFQSGEYETISVSNSTGTIQIEVPVAFKLYERTHSKAAEQFSDEALEHIDTVEAVRIALTGMSGPSWQPLDYRGFTKDKRAKPRVWRLRFSTEHFPDPTTQPDSEYTPMNPQPGFCVHVDP